MVRTPLDDEKSPRVPAQLFAALTAAHAQLTPDVLAPDVLKAGASVVDVGGGYGVLYPPGSRVVPVPAGRAAVLADGMDRPVLVGVPLGQARDTRYTGLAQYYRPEDLTDHLITGIGATLHGAPSGLGGCDGSEVGWQAGPYRWIDVYVALSDEGLLPDSPHPGTPAWAARGLALTAATAAEQLAELEAHPWLWQVDYRTVTGTYEPTMWESAITSLRNAVDPSE